MNRKKSQKIDLIDCDFFPNEKIDLNGSMLRFQTWGSVFRPFFRSGKKYVLGLFFIPTSPEHFCKALRDVRKFPQKCQKTAGYWEIAVYAGRRTEFRDKKSRDFSGEIFLERNYCPRTGFSGSNPWKIWSHPVMSWYGSRAVGCPIGREITARTVFSSWKRFKRRNTPRFRTLLFGKEAVKTFFYKCSNSGKMNPLHN